MHLNWSFSVMAAFPCTILIGTQEGTNEASLKRQNFKIICKTNIFTKSQKMHMLSTKSWISLSAVPETCLFVFSFEFSHVVGEGVHFVHSTSSMEIIMVMCFLWHDHNYFRTSSTEVIMVMCFLRHAHWFACGIHIRQNCVHGLPKLLVV